ncbi:hypothetical protein CCR91_13945 [Thiorhodovibrio winogradskyi]|nr:hypothetical protein [Thiorhodovibrio winogradskyi]
MEAPNGVKRLRELVYFLAVTGSLCPQKPAEGDGATLLRSIEALRSERIKRREFKRSPKPEGLSGAYADDLPAIPPSWVRTRLVDIGEISPKNDQSDQATGTFAPMSAISEMHRVAIDGEERPWVEMKKGYTHIADGDVVVAKITPCFENGKAAVVSDLANGFGAGTTELHVFRPLVGIEPSFVYLFVRSPYFRTAGIEHMTGTAGQKRLPSNYFATRPFPLPPSKEQQRIVAKVDELMALCDKLEAQQQANRRLFPLLSDATNSRLTEIADETALDAVFRKAGEVDPFAVRRSILRLAAFGKLTRQDPRAESAPELLTRIATARDRLLGEDYPNATEAKTQRKKQRQQRLPAELPALPVGWTWATLMQATALVVDCHNKTAPYTTSGIRLIRTTNIRNGEMNFLEPKFVAEATYERWSARCPPESGDLLITREAPMGEVCIIPDGVKICMGQRMMLIRTVPETMNPKFLLYSLMEPGLLDRVQDKPIGATVKHLRVGGVETLLLPVAPLEEQNRIVALVEQLFVVVDRLAAKREKRASVAESFAQAAVDAITGTASQESKPMQAPKTELVTRLEMNREQNRTPGADEPLAALLAEQDGALSAKALWQRSGLAIDAFYQQLKTEMAAGWIIEPEPARMRDVEAD